MTDLEFAILTFAPILGLFLLAHLCGAIKRGR